MSKNYTCPKCEKVCKNEHGLKIHTFRVHTHGNKKKTKTRAVVIDSFSELTPKIKSLAFCPCCGTDLRKVAVAITM